MADFERGLEVPEKAQKPNLLERLLNFLGKKDEDPVVVIDPDILAGLDIFPKEEAPKVKKKPKNKKKIKKKVTWAEDVDVLRCKPGPLKSYAEYDPMVAGI